MFSYPEKPRGRRMLISAPRPDSAMLRLRSLREAGVMNIRPGGPSTNVATLRQGQLSQLRRGPAFTTDVSLRLSAR